MPKCTAFSLNYQWHNQGDDGNKIRFEGRSFASKRQKLRKCNILSDILCQEAGVRGKKIILPSNKSSSFVCVITELQDFFAVRASKIVDS